MEKKWIVSEGYHGILYMHRRFVQWRCGSTSVERLDVCEFARHFVLLVVVSCSMQVG